MSAATVFSSPIADLLLKAELCDDTIEGLIKFSRLVLIYIYSCK